MPRLWEDTIDGHRRAVREATLDAVGRIVADGGLRAVTMSRLAAETGVARPTLYKHFTGVEAALLAWHERLVAGHLGELEQVAARGGPPLDRLRRVLEHVAAGHHRRHDAELSEFLHQGAHLDVVRDRLTEVVAGLVEQAAADGHARDDLPAGELAAFCLHAMTAAAALSSRAAVGRLVTLTLEGLQPR